MNLLTIIIGIIIILYLINGARTGLVDEVVHIISTILGLLVIFILAKGIGNFVQKSYENVLIALILLVVIRIINRIIKLITDSLELASKLPVINWMNHLLGAILGIFRACCLIWILFIVFGVINFMNINEWIQTQVAQNIILSTIYKTNIFVPLLKMLQ